MCRHGSIVSQSSRDWPAARACHSPIRRLFLLAARRRSTRYDPASNYPPNHSSMRTSGARFFAVGVLLRPCGLETWSIADLVDRMGLDEGLALTALLPDL